jgi:hypothetical protein
MKSLMCSWRLSGVALISSGIDKVRVFELPGGIWADGRSVGAPRIALVRWHSSWSGK